MNSGTIDAFRHFANGFAQTGLASILGEFIHAKRVESKRKIPKAVQTNRWPNFCIESGGLLLVVFRAMSNPSFSPLRFPRVLVTGAAGFVGHHLVAELAAHGHSVSTTDALPVGHPATAGLPDYRSGDLRDPDALRAIVRDANPDAVIHLAGIAFVPDGGKDPSLILGVNLAGTANVADAILTEVPKARMLFISSAQVYGTTVASDTPIRETDPLRPLSLYAITKAAGELALAGRAQAAGLDFVTARPANHIGPGQSPKFVVSAFAKKVLEAKAGRLSRIPTGNLESVRDFTDVRDVVRAYRLLLENGRSGEAYNIAANRPLRIGDMLGKLQTLAGVSVPTETDPALYRPTDACQAYDTAKLAADTGWRPEIPLDRTLADILDSLS